MPLPNSQAITTIEVNTSHATQMGHAILCLSVQLFIDQLLRCQVALAVHFSNGLSIRYDPHFIHFAAGEMGRDRSTVSRKGVYVGIP